MKARATFFLILLFNTIFLFSQEPQFEWAVGFGGTSSTVCRSIEVDNAGNVYSLGTFAGIVDFDPDTGVYFLTSNGGNDIFITKLNSSGNFVWAKSFGSNSSDGGNSIDIDAFGNIYVSGFFKDTTDFDPGIGVFNLISNGNDDIYISKFDSLGNFIWAKTMGGSENDGCMSIVVDSIGCVYSTGIFVGIADFDPGIGVYNLTSNGQNDVFVSKLDSSGNFIWAKSFSGSETMAGNSITLDTSEKVIITGVFYGTVDFDPGIGVYNLTSNGEIDVFISKLDSSGNFIWAKSFGSNSTDAGNFIATDADRNIYVTGFFHNTVDFDPGIGVFNLTSIGQHDVFISKLNSSGNFIWAKGIGGIQGDVGYCTTIDSTGGVYTTGYFEGTVDFDPDIGVYNLTSNGQNDVFISKLDSSGNFVWAKSFGGNNSDYGYCLNVDLSENVYSAGYFNGTVDFDPESGVFNITSGNVDAFVLKLSHPLSIANFHTSDTIIIVGDTTQFFDLTTSNPTNWLWDFGDGTTDTIQNPIHIYQNPGVYTVSLIVGNGFSTDTLVKENYITVLLQPNWAVDTTLSSHTILAQPTIPAKINGVQIQSGDYIGVFYDLDSGGIACGGYAEWTGNQVSLLAYGTETGMNNGFAANEEIKWKIWRASDYQEFDAVATYLPMPQQGNFVNGGISGLESLSAVSQMQISDSLSHVACFGDSTGAIYISVIGGLPPYSFLWSDGNTTQNYTNIISGNYFLTISDASGQNLIDSFEISQPASEITISITKTDVSVESAADGSIELDVLGGVPPYSYIWSNGETTEDIFNLAAGIYSVTVSDSVFCVVHESVEISDSTNAQSIILEAGFSMISTYINPYFPILDSVFSSVIGNLELIADDEGNVFWPIFSINQIGDIVIGEGYKVIMNYADSLQIIGEDVVPELNPVPIPEGWSMFGYLRQSPAPIDTMLYTITTNIILVKDDKGHVYWPQYGFNLIGDITPGEGYQIKMNGLDTLVYLSDSISWFCGDFISDIEGNQYSTVEIGTQCWMAENINIGIKIPTNYPQTNNLIIEKYCYNNDTLYCNTYGGLYEWDEAMMHIQTEGSQGICPIGWHIPTDSEWCTLENFVDSDTIECDTTGWRGIDAGGNLKGTGTNYWNSPNIGATNLYGFNALGAGRTSQSSDNILEYAYFWTSTIGSSGRKCRLLHYSNSQILRSYNNWDGFSVRCVKD
ncbi:MAG: PKD domain-containing protein [Bacteroidetes bacterium]|jgi:uncharacterized protein (TIGR02145 family)|nr:PKD domain-containing protein [Bacteroidota bacterium]MBT6686446.1 PKD domain-containing protein [Bacteroidota bacterium]MBT7144685.1 PKD domain-containing protein [Bacteroidota bacterium]